MIVLLLVFNDISISAVLIYNHTSKQYVGDPLSQWPHQHCYSVFDTGRSHGVRFWFSASDDEQHCAFLRILLPLVFSFGELSIQAFCPCLNWTSCLSCWYNLDVNSLLDKLLVNVSSDFVGCLWLFLLPYRNIWLSYNPVWFHLCCLCFGGLIQEILTHASFTLHWCVYFLPAVVWFQVLYVGRWYTLN